MLWFVEGQIRKTPYMGKEEIITHRALIEADDHDQAKEKYRRYWEEDKTEAYSVYYQVWDYEITETII